jgi:hypothetical protein
MANTVTALAARRRRAITLTAVVAAVLSALLVGHSLSLRNTTYLTGWVLLSVMLFLTVYNARKKLTYPPLVSSATWLQFHVYTGLLSFLLFLFHIGFRIPNGRLETIMAALYVTVAGSGVAGILLSRTLPARLAVRGEEVLFERIPIFRRRLREEAEQLVVECAEATHTTTLADFYKRDLAAFFDRPRHLWHHLLQSTRPRHNLLNELHDLDRYFDDRERSAARRLAELIEAKDHLDYHYAIQAVLKGWLFLHIPLTYALLIFVAVHVMLVHAF